MFEIRELIDNWFPWVNVWKVVALLPYDMKREFAPRWKVFDALYLRISLPWLRDYQVDVLGVYMDVTSWTAWILVWYSCKQMVIPIMTLSCKLGSWRFWRNRGCNHWSIAHIRTKIVAQQASKAKRRMLTMHYRQCSKMTAWLIGSGTKDYTSDAHYVWWNPRVEESIANRESEMISSIGAWRLSQMKQQLMDILLFLRWC